MKKLKSFYYCVLIALCNSVVFTSCNQDASEDWSEVINLYVDDELGEYRPWGHPENAGDFCYCPGLYGPKRQP